MRIGAFMPVSNNERLLSENTPQYKPSFELNKAVAPAEAVLRARIGALRAFDIDRSLSDITTPTLVCAAMDDTLVPWTCSQHLAAGLPRAQLKCLPHGGHAHNITQPDTFNQGLLSFLAEQRSPAATAPSTAPPPD